MDFVYKNQGMVGLEVWQDCLEEPEWDRAGWVICWVRGEREGGGEGKGGKDFQEPREWRGLPKEILETSFGSS